MSYFLFTVIHNQIGPGATFVYSYYFRSTLNLLRLDPQPCSVACNRGNIYIKSSTS